MCDEIREQALRGILTLWLEGGLDLGHIAGEDHRRRLHAVVRGVGRVFDSASQRVINLDDLTKSFECFWGKSGRLALGHRVKNWHTIHGGDCPTVDGPGGELSQA